MNNYLNRTKSNVFYRIVSVFIAVSFIFSSILPPSYAQFIPSTVLNLPLPGTMLSVSNGFTPTIVRGITIHPDNPLLFDFIVDTGNADLQGEAFSQESKKLVKYFLASLTVPEDEMWVNLSPYEHDHIIPEGLGVTELGKDLLAQDYILKQLTASLMYPENDLGKKFWNRVYKKAQEKFGTTDIPMNTFNKVWIVPDKAVVYEHEGSAFVVERHLKVMLEEDYWALENNLNNKRFGIDSLAKTDAEIASGVSSEVVREVLIPEIEKEVNEGKNFANLRQIFNSMILATWYKKNLKESLLGHVYMDRNKTGGIDVEDKRIKQKIYDQYIEAFKTGVYDYIKEDYDPTTQQIIPRKYFSGGVEPGVVRVNSLKVLTGSLGEQSSPVRRAVAIPVGSDRKVFVELAEMTDDVVSSPIQGKMFSGTTEQSTIAQRVRTIVAERQRVRVQEGRFYEIFQTPEQTAALQEPVQNTYNISAYAGRSFYRDLLGHFRNGTTIGTFGVTNNVASEAVARSKVRVKVQITDQIVREIIGLDASKNAVGAFKKDLINNGYVEENTGLVTAKFLELTTPADMKLDGNYGIHTSLIYLRLMKNVWKHIQGFYNGGWAAIMKLGATDQARAQYEYLVKLAKEMTVMLLSHARAQEAAIGLMGLTEDEEINFRRSTEFVNFYIPIFMDIDEGHLKPQQLIEIDLTVQGGVLVAAVHLEDQCHGAKKCGHMSGKALTTTKDYVQALNMVKAELERLGLIDVLVVGRTDAEAAEWVSGQDDARDQRFLLGVTGEINKDVIQRLLRTAERQIRQKVQEQVGQRKIKAEEADQRIQESLGAMENMVRDHMIDENGRLIPYNKVITFAREVKNLEGADLQVVHKAWKEIAQLKTIDEVIEKEIRSREGSKEALNISLKEWREFIQSIPFTYSGSTEKNAKDTKDFIEQVTEKAEELGIIVHGLKEYRRLKRLYPKTFKDGKIHVVWDAEAAQMHDESRHYWMIKSGIPMAVARNMAAQRTIDIAWMEQKRANIIEVMIWAMALDQAAVDLLVAENYWNLLDGKPYGNDFKAANGEAITKMLRTYLVDRRKNPSEAFETVRDGLMQYGITVETALHLINSVSRIKANNTSPSFRWPFAKVGVPKEELEAVFDEIMKFHPSFQYAGLDAEALSETPRDMTDEERKSFLDDQGVDVQFQFSTYFGELLNHVLTQLFNEGITGRDDATQADIRKILVDLFNHGYLRDGMFSVSKIQELGYAIDNAFTDNTQIFAGMVFDSLRQAYGKGEATTLDPMRGSGSTQAGGAVQAEEEVVGDASKVVVSEAVDHGVAVDMTRFERPDGTGVINKTSKALIARLMEDFGSRLAAIRQARLDRLTAIKNGTHTPGIDDINPDEVLEDAYGNELTVREILAGGWQVNPVPEPLAKPGAVVAGRWTRSMAMSALSGRVITKKDREVYDYVLNALQKELPEEFLQLLDTMKLKKSGSDGETVSLDEKVAYVKQKLKNVQEKLANTDKTVPVRVFADMDDGTELHGAGNLKIAQTIADIVNGRLTEHMQVRRDGSHKQRKTPPRKEWPAFSVRVADLGMDSRYVTYKEQAVPEIMTTLVFFLQSNFEALVNDPNQLLALVYPKLESPAEVKLVIEMVNEIRDALGIKPRTHGILENETTESAINLRLMLWAGRKDIALTTIGRVDKVAADERTAMLWKGQTFGDLEEIGMTEPHMNAYVEQNLATANAVGAKTDGKVRVSIPSEESYDPKADRVVNTNIVLDVLHEWLLGYDTGWVAATSYVPIVQALYEMPRGEYEPVIKERPYDEALFKDLLDFQVEAITREGLKSEVHKLLSYFAGSRNTALSIAIDSQKGGQRQVFDAATTSQITYQLWSAVHFGAKLSDAEKAPIDMDLINTLIDEVIVETMPRYKDWWKSRAEEEINISKMMIQDIVMSKNPVLNVKQLMAAAIDQQDLTWASRKVREYLTLYNERMDEQFGQDAFPVTASSPVALEAKVGKDGATVFENYKDIYTPEALDVLRAVAPLTEKLEKLRTTRETRFIERRNKKEKINFLPETNPDGSDALIAGTNITVKDARAGNFEGAPIPADLQRQWIQLTGPAAKSPQDKVGMTIAESTHADMRNIAHALLSGADGMMFDGEDALGQLGTMSLDNIRALTLAYKKDQTFLDVVEEVAREYIQKGKRPADWDYRNLIDENFTTRMYRARGLHLDDRHVKYTNAKGKQVSISASIADIVLYVVNNYKTLKAQGSSITLYLPKLQTAEEAAFMAEIMDAVEDQLGLERGEIKAFVLIEQLEETFQLMEMRAALGKHFVGYNTGRWDYIADVIKQNMWDNNWVPPNFTEMTMTYPYMHNYEKRVVQAVNIPDRNGNPVLWIGGMEPQIPVVKGTISAQDKAQAIENAMQIAEKAKLRELTRGASGTWVAHPGMVQRLRKVYEKNLFDATGKVNQLGITENLEGEDISPATLKYDQAAADALTELRPGKRTIAELRFLVSVALQYGNAFLTGRAAAALKGADLFVDPLKLFIMEDMATGEGRSKLTRQWWKTNAPLTEVTEEDTKFLGISAGTNITQDLVRTVIEQEYQKLLTAPDNIVFKTSKTRELPIAKMAVERFLLNKEDLPWLIDILNVALNEGDLTKATTKVDEYIKTYEQSGGLTRITEDPLFVASSPVIEDASEASSLVKDKEENVGGINLNPAFLDLQIKRDGKGVPLPLPQQPLGEINIDGFLPVIINITPVNLPLLLGGDFSGEEDSNDLSFNSLDPMDHMGRFEFGKIEEVAILN